MQKYEILVHWMYNNLWSIGCIAKNQKKCDSAWMTDRIYKYIDVKLK